jgi:glycosyltransferase involved in cell wall biosynthesis
MQLGTPVLTSQTSSLAEVAGDAAVLVDPYDVSAILRGLQALDQDEALRASCSERGLQRAEFFSKQRYRERLADLYHRAGADMAVMPSMGGVRPCV